MGWWGIFLGLIAPFVRDIWSHKTSETLFVFVIFSILDWGPKQINVLLTSPSNQFRDYFIWNRIEKLMPQLWIFSPQTLKTFKTTDQLVFKPWLFAEIWVSENPGFVHGFSTDFPWISHPMDFRGGRGSGRQKSSHAKAESPGCLKASTAL